MVIILLDDVGYGQTQTYGGPIHTPTLDRVADTLGMLGLGVPRRVVQDTLGRAVGDGDFQRQLHFGGRIYELTLAPTPAYLQQQRGWQSWTVLTCGLLLVNPRVPVATPAVFRARQGGFSPPAELPAAWPDAARMAADLARLGNDLEAPALSLCPVIGEVLAALRATPGCLLARMSGSGATCFGLFADGSAAHEAARRMPAEWWAAGGELWGQSLARTIHEAC